MGALVSMSPGDKLKKVVERLKIGDSVVLRGQRLVMTVRAVEQRKATCDWHNENGDWVQADFSVLMLERATGEDEEDEKVEETAA